MGKDMRFKNQIIILLIITVMLWVLTWFQDDPILMYTAVLLGWVVLYIGLFATIMQTKDIVGISTFYCMMTMIATAIFVTSAGILCTIIFGYVGIDYMGISIMFILQSIIILAIFFRASIKYTIINDKMNRYKELSSALIDVLKKYRAQLKKKNGKRKTAGKTKNKTSKIR